MNGMIDLNHGPAAMATQTALGASMAEWDQLPVSEKVDLMYDYAREVGRQDIISLEQWVINRHRLVEELARAAAMKQILEELG